MNDPRFYPLGENALTISFRSEISPEINQRVITLSAQLEKNPFPGFTECVPAYSSLTIFFDPVQVHRSVPDFPTAAEAVRCLIEKHLEEISETAPGEPRSLQIAVDFGGAAGPDLEHVAAANGLSADKVIDLFTGADYRVYMLGFLPGFAYMGRVDQRIATPRKKSPRKTVPAGSVGIAGRQTGIYPLESPGGWQIIGRTEQKLFTPEETDPVFFRPGDTVKFFKM